MRRTVVAVIMIGILTGPARTATHALLGETNEVVWGLSMPDAATREAVRQAIGGVSTSEALIPLTVDYPLDGAVFPPDMAAPTFTWSDPAGQTDAEAAIATLRLGPPNAMHRVWDPLTIPPADTWLIDIACDGIGDHLYILTQGATPPSACDSDPRTASEAAAAYKPPAPPVPPRRWRPGLQTWERIKALLKTRDATVTIIGFHSAKPDKSLSRGCIRISISGDPVGAPIFYRDVPLPFRHTLKNVESIRWRLGEVSSYQPPTLLTGMKVCGNCHSFTPDGKTLAMDVDYGSDKGSYVIAEVRPQTVLAKAGVISWSDYQRQDNEPTFGLLAQISPDGRYVVSTVKDRSVFAAVDELFYSQRFFPVAGILVAYDRQAKKFFSINGADDRRHVQSNPVWSPDGERILFARAPSYSLTGLKDPSSAVVEKDEVAEFFEGGRKFLYDVYSIDFNDGQGGSPTPLPGASCNGKSNYFPRFSPDGRWIVFCQSDSFMLLRPDSALHIMPSAGGTPRLMRCNFPGKMNSWHSWSPNGKWLVFASKAAGPFTQLWLTHIDAEGNDSPAVLLEHFTAADRAANIPEFVNIRPAQFTQIRQEFADYYTYFRIAVGYEQNHEYGKAVQEFQRALAEEPNHVESLYLLASCLARLDRQAEAMPYAHKATLLAPGSPVAHGLLGSLFAGTGRYAEARTHLEAGYSANPGDVTVANNLAWLLATCPEAAYRDGTRALRLAEWACKATAYKSPPLLDSLAAAYAETGRFDEAIRTIKQAIEIVRRNPRASTETLESRLKLYRARQPYHEPPPK